MDFQSDRPEGYTGKADQYIPDVIQGLKRVLIKAQDSLTNKTLHLSKRNLGELASVLVEFAEGIHTLESIIKYFSKLYRNFYFIYAGYTMYGVENPPCGSSVPACHHNVRRGGCKLVLVKTGITQKKHNPLNPPLLRGTA